MTETSNALLEETAAAYESRLAPVLFRPLAHLLAERIEIGAKDRILDAGCGTGVLARALSERAGTPQGIVGLDANPGMIAVARARQPAIDWVQGDALDMPFPDRAFDIVASQFVLMLLEDRVAALREMRRVLKPEGVLHVALFEGLAVNSGYDRIARAYEREAGADVADALRFPFSLGDLGELRALFDEAGLPAPECETLTVTARFENAMALTLADVRGWFPFAGLSLNEAEIDGVAARLDADFGALGGAVAFEVHAHLLTVD